MKHQEVNYIDKEEEIDLVKVFKKTKGAFARNKKLFFIFLIIGLTLGLLYYYVTPKTYKSRMIISSSLFQGPSFVLILDHLKILIQEGNHEQLALALKISVQEAEQVTGMDIFSSRNYAQEEFGERVSFKEDKMLDVTDKKEEFVIEAYVKDNSVFKALEKGIIHFIKSNPTIKENSSMKEEVLHDMKKNINHQRVGLDSLKNSLVSSLTRDGRKQDIYISSPGSMYSDMIELFNAELKITEALIASKIDVIESFRIYKRQHSPKFIPSVFGFTFVFLMLYLIVVIYLEGSRTEDSY